MNRSRVYVVVFAIMVIMSAAAIKNTANAAKKSSTNGKDYHVLEKKEHIIKILLNDELLSGTDSACQRVEDIIQNLRSKGFRVIIENDGWKPTIDTAAIEADLDRKASRTK